MEITRVKLRSAQKIPTNRLLFVCIFMQEHVFSLCIKFISNIFSVELKSQVAPVSTSVFTQIKGKIVFIP